MPALKHVIFVEQYFSIIHLSKSSYRKYTLPVKGRQLYTVGLWDGDIEPVDQIKYNMHRTIV